MCAHARPPTCVGGASSTGPGCDVACASTRRRSAVSGIEDPTPQPPSPADDAFTGDLLGDPTGDREVLAAGVTVASPVTRIGPTVRRALSGRAAFVHRFLEHLESVGFEGAPRLLGQDIKGREVLTFIRGETADPPFPSWVADDELLVSVAALQRDLHVAAEGFRIPRELEVLARRPSGLLADLDGDLVCHQDLCIENVVVRDGRAHAFIDFDLAGPCDPVLDIAIAARHWVPLRAPGHLGGGHAGLDDADLQRRFAAFCDVHELDRAGRGRVVAAARRFLEAVLPAVRERASGGHAGFTQLWDAGYEAQNLASQRWLARYGEQLESARA
ncbi:phosphotransferase [Nitriliruptoraceae bacterium ZYF776]|nr:phosphotransferase [Profundirhabdus halotolerans]